MPHQSPTRRSPQLLALVAVAACAAPPKPPVVAPAIVARATHYAGDPLAGPLGRDAAAALELAPEHALHVTARIYLVAQRPGDRYEPLEDHVRLIVAEGGAEPLAPRSLLTPGTRLATGAEAAALARDVAARPPTEATLAATLEGLSVPGVTTSLAAAHEQPIELTGHRPAERHVTVELWREEPDAAELSIALLLTDVFAVVEHLAEGEPEVELRPRTEKLVLEPRIAAGGDPVVVFAPARFDPKGRLAYVLVLEVDAPPSGPNGGGALAEWLDRVRAEVDEEAVERGKRRRRFAAEENERLRGLRAIDALGRDGVSRRAAILELAGHAPLAAELALSADDELLGMLVERLGREPRLLRELAGERDALAWRLERTAVALLVELSDQEPSADRAALLLRYTGQAGRYPGALEDAAAASSSVPGFYARVLEENRIALEDSSPSARVRAYDWLAAEGLEVPGYDPLAGRSERRAALRAWERAEEEARAAAAAEASSAAEDGAR